jgi:gliding motility-associated lipoprotein GldH
MRHFFFSIVAIVIIVGLSGCGGKKPVEQIRNFDNATWNRFDILSFDLPISQANAEYSLFVVMRHHTDFEPATMPLHFIMKQPNGTERIWEQTITIKNRDNEYLGQLRDGVYELQVPVRTRLMLSEAGNVHISVEQYLPKYNTYGVISFGLRAVSN